MAMRRSEAVALIMPLREQGMVAREIAEQLGLTRSMVASVLADPDGSKQKKRRERYRGTCIDCGGPTDGSCGYASCTLRCAACAAVFQHENRKWTRETIIDAIQRWAAVHGRPPSALDWVRSDQENNYPAFSSCYRQKGIKEPPFETWADAIEAAGFKRPRVGLYEGRTDWTRENIIEWIVAYHHENGEPPHQDDLKGGPAYATICSRFGTFGNAIVAAGYTPHPRALVTT